MPGGVAPAYLRWIASVRRLLPRGSSLPEDAWWSRHRAIVALLWLHAAAIPVYALIRGFSLGHTIVESSILPATAIAAGLNDLPRRLRTAAASLGLLSASAVLVHLSGGVIEMHFHFFVMVTVVALYQDWFPFLAAIAYVLLHHGLVGAVDPKSVFNHPAAWNNPWKWAAIHALFIAGISAVCLVTWRLNERLYASERDAREGAERAHRRLAILAEASRVLTATLDADTLLRHLATLITRAVADVCIIDIKEDDGHIRRAVATASAAVGDIPHVIREGAPTPDQLGDPVIQAMSTGETQIVDRITRELLEEAMADESERDAVERAQPTSAAIVPLIGRDEAFGALSISTSHLSGNVLTSDDIQLVEELSRRAASAIENARLYARQRTAAEMLQHSLLPEKLPELPGVEATARYLAGGPGLEVGGDWYDLFEVPDGSLVLVMGDVVGRGVEAASLMGQLRNALRAYALEGYGPAAAATRLNDYLHEIGPSEHMATVIVAKFDPATGQVRMTNAGHPPPLVMTPSGSCGPVDVVGGIPVGALPNFEYREGTLTLSPGSTFLLYTDGLVEDRTLSLDEGINRVCRAMAEAPPDLDALCDYVLEQSLEGRDTSDDVALLALQPLALGEHLHMRLPARPAILKPLRATLRRWLIEAGAREDEVLEILVASGEACTNAIQHATGAAAQNFDVELRLDGAVEISVRDGGRWRRPRMDGGGRGLDIMREFMDDVDVIRGPKGTEVRMRRGLVNSI